MNKDEAVTFLKKKGYQAENDRGVVTIIYDRPKMVSEYKQILAMLREQGYIASFGMKAATANMNQGTDASEKIDNLEDLEPVEDLEDFDADEEEEEVDSSQLSFFENGNGQLSFL